MTSEAKQLERRIERLESVVSKVIAWNAREFGIVGVQQLLGELDIKEQDHDK